MTHLWIMLIVTVSLALAISFLCSVLEATLLSVGVAELLQREEAGDKGASLLLVFKRERMEDAISAILTFNTIAHTVGAALAGAQAANIARAMAEERHPNDIAAVDSFEQLGVGVFSAILTVLILVLTEIIPKTLGTVHANSLSGVVGRALAVLTKVLSPLVVVMSFLTRLIARGGPEGVSRGDLQALAALAAREGAIEVETSRVVDNVLRFKDVPVEDVMTPRTVTVMRPVTMTLQEFTDDDDVALHSRIPVYEGTPDHVVGYVLQRQVLRALATGKDGTNEIREFCIEIEQVPRTLSLPLALRSFLDRHEHISIVTDKFGGVAGLITLEDVLETILGVEIMDESDEVADLRALAVRKRDERLAQRNREFRDR